MGNFRYIFVYKFQVCTFLRPAYANRTCPAMRELLVWRRDKLCRRNCAGPAWLYGYWGKSHCPIEIIDLMTTET